MASWDQQEEGSQISGLLKVTISITIPLGYI